MATILSSPPALKLRFLDELAQHGNVRVAAGRVGVSRSGLYLARRRDSAFAAGWLAALREARWHAEAVLAERALEGVEEQVFYHGEVIATRRRYDTRLLLAHLARLDALCAEEPETEPFDVALAQVAGLDCAPPPPDRAAHLDQVAERAGMRFDQSEPFPCLDAIERKLGDRLDKLSDKAREKKLDDAFYTAEAAFHTARGRSVSAAVREAAAAWEAQHEGYLAEVDALRGDPPFEVKGLLGDSRQGAKMFRCGRSPSSQQPSDWSSGFGADGRPAAPRDILASWREPQPPPPHAPHFPLQEPCPLCPLTLPKGGLAARRAAG